MQPALTFETSGVLTVGFNSNGNYLMTAGKDRTVKLWSSSTGEDIKNYSGGHNYEITALAICNDNSKFTSSGFDSSIVLWDVTKGSVIVKFQGHKKKVNSLNWNFTDTLIASASDDSTVKIWDIREKHPVDNLTAAKDSVVKIYSNTDQYISASVDGFIQTYDIRCGVIYTDNLKSILLSVDIGRNGEFVASTHIDDILRVTNRPAGQIVRAFAQTSKSQDFVTPCAFTSDLKVVIGDQHGEIGVYDINTGPSKRWKGHTSQVVKVVAHPVNPNVFASASHDAVKIWRIK